MYFTEPFLTNFHWAFLCKNSIVEIMNIKNMFKSLWNLQFPDLSVQQQAARLWRCVRRGAAMSAAGLPHRPVWYWVASDEELLVLPALSASAPPTHHDTDTDRLDQDTLTHTHIHTPGDIPWKRLNSRLEKSIDIFQLPDEFDDFLFSVQLVCREFCENLLEGCFITFQLPLQTSLVNATLSLFVHSTNEIVNKIYKKQE